MEADNVSAIPRCATECCDSLYRRSRACPQTPLPLSPLPTAQLRSLGSRAGDNATERRLATQRRRPGGSRAKAALPRPTKSRPPSRLAGHSKGVEFGSAPCSCSRVVNGGGGTKQVLESFLGRGEVQALQSEDHRCSVAGRHRQQARWLSLPRLRLRLKNGRGSEGVCAWAWDLVWTV